MINDENINYKLKDKESYLLNLHTIVICFYTYLINYDNIINMNNGKEFELNDSIPRENLVRS